MRDISLASSALSDLYYIKGAAGGFDGAPPGNKVHYTAEINYTTELWTAANPKLKKEATLKTKINMNKLG